MVYGFEENEDAIARIITAACNTNAAPDAWAPAGHQQGTAFVSVFVSLWVLY